MNLSESYKNRIKQLAGIVKENFEPQFENMQISELPITKTGLVNFFHFGPMFIYNSTYKRIFLLAGDIALNNEEGNDGIPTILVDKTGENMDFVDLKAENCFKILNLPEDFNYELYAKSKS